MKTNCTDHPEVFLAGWLAGFDELAMMVASVEDASPMLRIVRESLPEYRARVLRDFAADPRAFVADLVRRGVEV